MFRDHAGEIIWNDIWSFGMLCVLALGLFVMLYKVITISNRQMDERKTFKEACIDAGGYPVSTFDYVKGHGEGFLCINPSAIIQMKEESK